MNWQLIRLDEVPASPWRNGGGVTRELLAWPEAADWCCRLSVAEVTQDGPFSRFDGVQRWFAVLGGAFGEGIDLPGTRLIGAFVVTLGLPQVNPVNEAFRQRLNQLYPGRGHDYTYLFPGLQKVVQAAGRVIRTPTDTGTVWLLDERYTRPGVRALLPDWWRLAHDAAAQPPIHNI